MPPPLRLNAIGNKAKDSRQLLRAIKAKLTAQAQYVIWRDSVVVPSRKNGAPGRENGFQFSNPFCPRLIPVIWLPIDGGNGCAARPAMAPPYFNDDGREIDDLRFKPPSAIGTTHPRDPAMIIFLSSRLSSEKLG